MLKLEKLFVSIIWNPRCFFHQSAALNRNLDARAIPPSKEPSSNTGRWVTQKPFKERYEYTTEPLPFPRTGGRGPNGRIWNYARCGGDAKVFRMIDHVRGGPYNVNETEREELVKEIKFDAVRSAYIALVAHDAHKRWIIATDKMKEGDIVKSTRFLSRTPVRAEEGNSYPIGSLPIGTLVCHIEKSPDTGGVFARAAGVSALLLRKEGNNCVVRLPSKREILISSNSACTVGRISNIDHNKRILGKAGAARWLGYKPSSGRWHKKDGRFGRVIKPIKPTKSYMKSLPEKPEVKRVDLR